MIFTTSLISGDMLVNRVVVGHDKLLVVRSVELLLHPVHLLFCIVAWCDLLVELLELGRPLSLPLSSQTACLFKVVYRLQMVRCVRCWALLMVPIMSKRVLFPLNREVARVLLLCMKLMADHQVLSRGSLLLMTTLLILVIWRGSFIDAAVSSLISGGFRSREQTL